jgi:uncharacterized protein
MESKYQRIREIIEKEMSCPAHNIEHVIRVHNLCLHLAGSEPNINLGILRTAALLHDIARVREDQDDSGNTEHATLGAEMAGEILDKLGYSTESVESIKHCIAAHRFRSGDNPRTGEAKILFDADKLDIIGSVGVARSFMIAGQYGERLYSDVPIDEYIRENLVGGSPGGRIREISKHAPNLEFETKVKHIPDRLYTQEARRIALQRVEFMKQFFGRLEREIAGEI